MICRSTDIDWYNRKRGILKILLSRIQITRVVTLLLLPFLYHEEEKDVKVKDVEVDRHQLILYFYNLLFKVFTW